MKWTKYTKKLFRQKNQWIKENENWNKYQYLRAGSNELANMRTKRW